jgi:hypothetical protein
LSYFGNGFKFNILTNCVADPDSLNVDPETEPDPH